MGKKNNNDVTFACSRERSIHPEYSVRPLGMAFKRKNHREHLKQLAVVQNHVKELAMTT